MDACTAMSIPSTTTSALWATDDDFGDDEMWHVVFVSAQRGVTFAYDGTRACPAFRFSNLQRFMAQVVYGMCA